MSRPSRRVVRPVVAPTPVPLAFVLPPVVAAFAPLPDPRVGRTKRHGLLDIVAISLCAVLAGAEGWVDIAEFGRAREAWFRASLALPHGIPSHDTFGRVFARLDPAAFARYFQAWVATVATLAQGEVVALDGKTVRGSGRLSAAGAAREGALHVVSAWACAAGLTLRQVTTSAKENKITALPELLALPDVTGAVVTVDAIGCQTALAAQVRAQGADYLPAVKTSLAPEAARLGDVVRRHWGIENRCHWTLDVSFHEDACRIRTDHAPENLALVRKVALALLRHDRTHTHGLTSKRLRAGWDHDYLQTVLRGARPDLDAFALPGAASAVDVCAPMAYVLPCALSTSSRARLSWSSVRRC